MKNIKAIYIQIISKLTGLLFFASGLTKIIDSESFIELLFKYKLGILSFLGPLISPIEIIIGVCFILGLFIRKTALFTFILTSFFTILYLNAYFRLGIADCGCFGEYISTTPTIVFLRNIFILIGTFWVWYNTVSIQNNRIKVFILIFISSFAFTISGYTIDNSLFTRIFLINSKGKSIKNLNFSVPYSFPKEYGLFIFSPKCSHCWNVTNNIKQLQEEKVFGKIIGVVTEDRRNGLENYIKVQRPNFKIIIVPTGNFLKTIGHRVPKLIVVKNSHIQNIYENSEIPCPAVAKAQNL